jgi:MFS family permease
MNAIIGLWLGPTFIFLLTRRGAGEQYLTGLFAEDPAGVGWVLLGYAIVFGAGVTIWSFVLDRIARKKVLYISLVAMLVVCAGLYVLNHSGSWSGASRWMLLAGIAAAIMVESGFTPAALALLADIVDASSGRGSAMGIYSALLGLGALAGSLMAGLLGASLAVDGLIFGTVALAFVAMITIRSIPSVAGGGVHG